jgi:citrate lyase subunit beta/citryl-CoA lyase
MPLSSTVSAQIHAAAGDFSFDLAGIAPVREFDELHHFEPWVAAGYSGDMHYLKGDDVSQLAHRTGNIPVHAIVTETPTSLFGLMSYRNPASPLAAMSWGAEDLSAALGASSKYDANGDLSFTYKLARSLCLAGAVAAGVQPVDGVFADFKDDKGLRGEAEAARREGFTGKLAIHPAQVGIINAAFTPSAEDVRDAEAIVAAFEAQPEAGVLSIDGKMVDRPHLTQARRVLERAARQ